MLLSGGMGEFNLHEIAAKDMSPHALEEAVDCLPMMAERTLIQVTDYDLFKAGEKDREEYIHILSQLPEYCCVVFVYDLIDYKGDARTKLAAALKAHGTVVNFIRQDQGDLVDWVRRRFHALGKEIDSRLALDLIFLCGDLMTNLISEIGKIAADASAPRVSRGDIDAVAIPQIDAVVFQMTEAIARKDFDKAASVLSDLLHDQQSPIMILSVMGKYFRQLYTARLCLEAGGGRDQFMSLWNMRYSYQADKLLDAARKFSLPWCRHTVRRCAQTDLAMKSYGGNEEELLIALLMELSAGRKVIR